MDDWFTSQPKTAFTIDNVDTFSLIKIYIDNNIIQVSICKILISSGIN